MVFSDALRLIEIFHARDYAQERPHFYVRSKTTNSWVRPKGMRVLPPSEGIAILDVEREEWETIPYGDFSFGLW